jgi:hypothetical protein
VLFFSLKVKIDKVISYKIIDHNHKEVMMIEIITLIIVIMIAALVADYYKQQQMYKMQQSAEETRRLLEECDNFVKDRRAEVRKILGRNDD